MCAPRDMWVGENGERFTVHLRTPCRMDIPSVPLVSPEGSVFLRPLRPALPFIIEKHWK